MGDLFDPSLRELDMFWPSGLIFLPAAVALLLFLIPVFYEVMLLPMYFLIGVWGAGRRKYAAVKFVIYTLFGSVGLLAAMIALYSLDVRDFVDQNVVAAKADELKREQHLPDAEA